MKSFLSNSQSPKYIFGQITVFICAVFIATSVKAQDGLLIDYSTPQATRDNSAVLDIRSDEQGVLVPRVALTAVTDNTTVAAPATSLLIYNTGTGGLTPAGYYYNTGTPASPSWTKLVSGNGNFPTGNGNSTEVAYWTAQTPWVAIQDYIMMTQL